MKILRGVSDIGRPMTEAEMNPFLQSKLNMQKATVDKESDPIIQPVWFVYDQLTQKIYFNTDKEPRKLANIQRRQKVCFSIDI